MDAIEALGVDPIIGHDGGLQARGDEVTGGGLPREWDLDGLLLRPGAAIA